MSKLSSNEMNFFSCLQLYRPSTLSIKIPFMFVQHLCGNYKKGLLESTLEAYLFFPCFFFFFLMKNPSVLEVTRRMSSQPNMAFSEHHIIAKIPYTCIGEIGVVGQTTARKTKIGN